MFYTAYDGSNPPRVAMTDIPVKDFDEQHWDKWSEPVLITAPTISNKDCCLFPEKIKGKFAIIHRIEPDIVFDFVDDLDFAKHGQFLEVKGKISPRPERWDSEKIGINTAPLKTKQGWLILYHGLSRIDRHYRLGALLLDLKDPCKVLGRTPYPILQPETLFER